MLLITSIRLVNVWRSSVRNFHYFWCCSNCNGLKISHSKQCIRCSTMNLPYDAKYGKYSLTFNKHNGKKRQQQSHYFSKELKHTSTHTHNVFNERMRIYCYNMQFCARQTFFRVCVCSYFPLTTASWTPRILWVLSRRFLFHRNTGNWRSYRCMRWSHQLFGTANEEANERKTRFTGNSLKVVRTQSNRFHPNRKMCANNWNC